MEWILAATLLLCDDEKAELGKVVPELLLKDLTGKEVKLSELRGKAVLIHFWSYKCPSGTRILSEVRELAEKCEKDGVVFFGICSYGESEAQLKKFAEKEQVKYPLCFDSQKKGAKLFGAEVVTTSYVLDKEGKLVYRGAWDKAWDAAAAAKEGKEVEVKETKAKG